MMAYYIVGYLYMDRQPPTKGHIIQPIPATVHHGQPTLPHQLLILSGDTAGQKSMMLSYLSTSQLAAYMY